jgi:hypothetical protein
VSYSKHLDTYPEEFGQLIERAALGEITLPLDPIEAKRLMGRLYAYKGALSRAAADLENVDNPLLQDLARYSRKVQLRVTPAGLVLRPLDQDTDAQLIRSFLGHEPTAGDRTTEGHILVPINPAHLPPWLAELAEKRKV